LIEVVAGLTLMATVLVASLLSFSAHHRQRRLAESKLSAVAVADELLNTLSVRRGGFPKAGRGTIPGHPTWFWQTRMVGVAAPARVPLHVIRLEVLEVTPEGSLLPLATVEIVEPVEA
jgi:hypothetical protein